MMSYVIIGGGIAGLYCAYSLHIRFGLSDIIVVEKDNRLGGRINTIHVDNQLIELGAGGVVNVQHNMFSLLSKLGISVSKGSSGRSQIITSTLSTKKITGETNPFVPTVYKIDNIINILDTDFYVIIEDLIKKLDDDMFRENARSYNLYALVEKIYGSVKADQLLYQFGYHDDFQKQNSVEALKMFEKEFRPDAKYHRVIGGMSYIIDKLTSYLKENNIKILTNTKFMDIHKITNGYNCIFDNVKKISTKNIILAVPKKALLKIPFLSVAKNKLKSISNKSLSRIYLFFPKNNNKVWFDHINDILTTNTLLSQISPINKSDGILMIYTDGQNAKTMHYLEKNNILEPEIMYHLIKLFSDIEIPKPIKIITSYYDTATHIWKPSINAYQMYYDIMQPIKNEKIFITGEAYSLNQQWCEGAVENVNDLMLLVEKNYEIS